MSTLIETISHPDVGERGVASWFATVDHKRIGILYIFTSVVFFLLGGSEALLMRTQLLRPNLHVVTPEAYSQLFSMHGTTMIFLFAIPLLTGFGNYLVPLMIGARDMAFPRLNAFAYWVYVLSGTFLYSSFLIGSAPNARWFAYAPLTERPYDPGPNMDFWTLGIIFLGISTTAGAINFIVTIFRLRAPGMSINRMPMFVWTVLVTSFILIFAIPPLTATSSLLYLDRNLGTHFFDPSGGGDPVLWQHLFWNFGHPEVYIMILPAMGMVSEILPVFSRKPIFGYIFVAWSTVAIGVLSFTVWAHHMFAVGLPLLAMSFFTATSSIIAIPTGVKIFNWIATIWGGKVIAKPPFLFAVAFVAQFVLGGISGVMVAVVPFDWQVEDTYFLVAHFHYVLFGGMAFGVFGGFYYWFPKMFGRMLNERLGYVNFWLMFVGFNLTFFPMHLSGMLGMPRWVYTYPAGLGWGLPNLLSTLGAYILAISVLVFLWNFFNSLRHGPIAGPDPWDAWTLEWATSSPPPVENFRSIPSVRSRRPLWDLKHPERADSRFAH